MPADASTPPVLPDGPISLPLSATIAPSDTSTSTVLTIDSTRQIKADEEGLVLHPDIVYTTRTLADSSVRPLRMDIFRPAPGGAPVPAVLYVPGGGFMISVREAVRDLRAYVTATGFVVASIEYSALTTGPGVTYADSIQDVKAAVRFLRAHAAEYGIDPAKIGVWGESAGGYLASMTGVTNGDPDFEAGENLDQSSAVQAVVNKFGGSALGHVAEDFDETSRAFWTMPGGPLRTYLHGPAGGSLDDGDETVEHANPVTHVTTEAPPFLLFHGDADTLISPSQTLRVHRALLDAGVPSERYVLSGAGHGDLAFLGDPVGGLPWSTTTVMDLITGFLHANLDS